MSEKSQDKTNAPGLQTHTARRVAYGVNVTVAIIVALAVTGLVNYIGYNYLFSYRKDFTATGEYSLAPQTRKVVEATEQPMQIVTLFGRSANEQLNDRIAKARGLVDEYGFISSKVTVDHIDPVLDVVKVDAFYQKLRKRYQEQIAPTDKAVKDGLEAVDQMQAQMRQQVQALDELLKSPRMPQGKLPETLQAVRRVIQQQESDFGQYRQQIQTAMERPLADYSGAITTLSSLLQVIDEKLFAQAHRLLEPFAQSPTTPDAIKNDLLKLMDQFIASRRQLKPTLDALAGVKPDPEYDQLYAQLATPQAVVVLSEEQVSVVTLDQMFRLGEMQGEVREVEFLGEEKITGALLGMQQKLMPMVVFVSSPQLRALGPQGEFQALGQRLENMRFRVEEWSPQGMAGPMGQMLPATDAPTALPGQRAVWIVLPIAPANPMMPMQTGGAQRVISLMNERTNVGDAAMIILNYAQAANVGIPDPLKLWAQDWGMDPLNDRMILREQTLPDRRTVAQNAHVINRWPDALPITQALSSFSGLFAASSPINLTVQPGGAENEDLRVYPLVEITGERLWTEREPAADSQFKPESKGERFVVAAAAQRGNSRLIVVADPVWATDRVTGMPQFPGNSELFVNSVYWLSGLEQMIAASARTQDIRRVNDISPNSLVALKWSMMAGMPILVAAAGLVVWLVRRRG